MEFHSVFKAIEETGLSVWIRESDSWFAFWAILSVHAIGMGILVGACVLIDLRILGLAPDLPLAPFKRFYSFIWVGFWIQVASGILLLVGYPTKSLTNLDFYLKLLFIAVALVVMQKLKNRVFTDATLSEAVMMARGKSFAIFSILLWVGAITAGRMLAYTYSTLTA